jgi:hypothetical protein
MNMTAKTEPECLESDQKKQVLNKLVSHISKLRPAGIWGFMAVVSIVYLYKYLQMGNF